MSQKWHKENAVKRLRFFVIYIKTRDKVVTIDIKTNQNISVEE